MPVSSLDLEPDDVRLYERAAEVLDAAHDPVIHQVAAALRTTDGEIFVGLHVGSRRVNVCAEAAAISNASMSNAGPVDSIVAVCRDASGRTIVTNPCGLCRELMGQYGPDAWVLVDKAGQVVKVPAASLLPTPWMFPHENDWNVAEPTATGEEQPRAGTDAH